MSESTKELHESKERKPEPETGGELLDAETEREMTEYGALCGAMGYCDPAALRRHLLKLRDRFDERLRREQERQSIECCVQCGEPKNRTNQAGDEVANGWPHCVNPSCVAFGQPVASASYRRVGLSRGAEPETLRCLITGNPVGTDTRPVGSPCPCANCSRVLSPRGDDGTAKAEATAESFLVKATEGSTERTEAPASDQIAPEECECEFHCWHHNMAVLTSLPPQWDEHCCHCATTRRVYGELPPLSSHGPHV